MERNACIHEKHKEQNLEHPSSSKIFSLEFRVFFLTQPMPSTQTMKAFIHTPANASRVMMATVAAPDEVTLDCCGE